MLLRRCLSAVVTALLLPSGVFSHGGGIDAYGGHNDRRAGGYHFHQGPLRGQSFATKAAGITALRNAQQNNVASTAATSKYSASSTRAATKNVTVYITRTGRKYHKLSCRHLRSVISISLSDAESRGYTACSVCGGK